MTEKIMDGVEDQLNSIRAEWNVTKEKWFHGEIIDPVFEGTVRDFCVFDATMQDIYRKVESFMKGVDQLSEGLLVLSESVIAGLSHQEDQLIASDSCKLREATNQITRADAPHSAIAKLRRDMDFNIMNPMRNHIINNRNLKANLDQRRRRLIELNSAKKQYDECVKKDLKKTDRRFLQAQSALDSAKMNFQEVDKHVFEWLYILEEYKGDILDSTLQTLKYLQYEFFATSSHAISGVLPSRMEFRPMVEMTPEHLESQVKMELEEEEQEQGETGEDKEVVTDFSTRLLDRIQREEGRDGGGQREEPAAKVDPLSLSSLLSQGFDEGKARRALRIHNNDTQAALDWLIEGGDETGRKKPPEDEVRMPTTIRRIQRLKAQRRARNEALRKQREAEEKEKDEEEERRNRKDRGRDSRDRGSRDRDRDDSPRNRGRDDSPPPRKEQRDLLSLDEAPPLAQQPPTDLLNMEPPPPTDFAHHVTVQPLPDVISFADGESAPGAGAAPPRPTSAGLESLGSLGAVNQVPAQAGSNVSPGSLAAEQQLAAARMFAAQSQLTPQQLLLQAQQLVAMEAQQSQQGISTAPQGLQGWPMAAPAASMPPSGQQPMGQAPGPMGQAPGPMAGSTSGLAGIDPWQAASAPGVGPQPVAPVSTTAPEASTPAKPGNRSTDDALGDLVDFGAMAASSANTSKEKVAD